MAITTVSTGLEKAYTRRLDEIREQGSINTLLTVTIPLANGVSKPKQVHVSFRDNSNALVSVTADVVVSLDSAYGANYDHTLQTMSFSSESSRYWTPDQDLQFGSGDGTGTRHQLIVTVPAVSGAKASVVVALEVQPQ